MNSTTRDAITAHTLRDSVAVLRHYTDALEAAAASGDLDAAQRASATIGQEVHMVSIVTGSQGTCADITRFNGRLALKGDRGSE